MEKLIQTPKLSDIAKNFNVWLIVIVVSILISMLSIFIYSSSSTNEKRIQELQVTIAGKDATIHQLDSALNVERSFKNAIVNQALLQKGLIGSKIDSALRNNLEAPNKK